MTPEEFTSWYEDYGRRFPAVNDYVNRRDDAGQEALLDTWSRTLEPFAAETCWEVTKQVIAGKLPPVANVDLGQFGEQIRQRCRQVLDGNRKAKPKPDEDKRPFVPLMNGSAAMALRCLKAAEAMRREAGQDTEIETRRVSPWHWSGAVIILADDHTPGEEAEAMRTLSSEELNWYEISKRAETTAVAIVQEVLCD